MKKRPIEISKRCKKDLFKNLFKISNDLFKFQKDVKKINWNFKKMKKDQLKF